jgi:hypothetical protein
MMRASGDQSGEVAAMQGGWSAGDDDRLALGVMPPKPSAAVTSTCHIPSTSAPAG